MAFTDDFKTVLAPFLKKYAVAKNETERKRVAKNAVEAVSKSKDLLEEKEVDLPKDLETVCLPILLSKSVLSNQYHYFRPLFAISRDV